uniref:B-cadherin-like n=1 Tax=Myxine glutinosa TaxID=7769 RepID=UPI00358E0585
MHLSQPLRQSAMYNGLYFIYLLVFLALVEGHWWIIQKQHQEQLLSRRMKRQWNVPPIFIPENNPNYLDVHHYLLESDQSQAFRYSLTGPGADLPPVGLFTLDSITGRLGLTRALDREQQQEYRLKAHAHRSDGHEVDSPCNVTIFVQDVNDEFPEFVPRFPMGNIGENALPGAVVMQLTATDRDDPETPNALIQFKMTSYSEQFSLNGETGVITVKKTDFDRMERDRYNLIVQAVDSNGAAFGLSTETMVSIFVLGENECLPQFNQTNLRVNAMENRLYPRLAELAVYGCDEEFGLVGKAVYHIVRGNIAGYFAITTDENTNAGILQVIKAIDYEKEKRISLVIQAENVVPFAKPYEHPSSSTVTITILDMHARPDFWPKVQTVPVDPSSPLGMNLFHLNTRCTEECEGMLLWFSMLKDPAGVVTIDPNSGVLRMVSPFPPDTTFGPNNTYAILVGVENTAANPPFTSTGTILLAIRGPNQHVPHLLDTSFCHDGHAWPNGSYSLAVLLVGEDPDSLSNGPPLSFTLSRKSPSNPYSWKIQQINDTAAWLSTIEPQQCGTYETWLSVRDRQGLAGPESKVTVQLCGCEAQTLLLVAGGIGLSDGAIAAIVLSILAVLLFAMLVCCLPLWLLTPVKKAPPSSFMNIVPGTVVTYSQEAGEEEKILNSQQNDVYGKQVSELQPRAVGMMSDVMPKVEIDGQMAGNGVQSVGAAAGQRVNDLIHETITETSRKSKHQHQHHQTNHQLEEVSGISEGVRNIASHPEANVVMQHLLQASNGGAGMAEAPKRKSAPLDLFDRATWRQSGSNAAATSATRKGGGMNGRTSWMQDSGEDMAINMLSQQLTSQSKQKDVTQAPGNKVQEHVVELQVEALDICAPDTLLVYNFEGSSSHASSLSNISEIQRPLESEGVSRAGN